MGLAKLACSQYLMNTGPDLGSIETCRSLLLMNERDTYGRVIESAVGSTLLARSISEGFDLYWWREGDREVDYIIRKGTKRTAIEVKSGRIKSRNSIKAFLESYPGTYALAIGSNSYTIEDFLLGKIPLFQ